MATERQEITSTNAKKMQVPRGRFLELIGLKPGEIAYNPARPVRVRHPITDNPAELLAVRVESKESDWLATQEDPEGIYDPRIELFERVDNNGVWRKIDPEYWKLEDKLDFFKKKEDPFITFIDGKMIVGCVRADAVEKPTVSTEFYIGTSFGNLQPLTEIRGMKDVRILGLNGKILVSTRPRGGEAGLGRMGFTLIDDLSQLTTERVFNTPIIKDQIPPDYWLGANELYLLGTNSTTRVGVLGHIAHEESGKSYAAMIFELLNPGSVNKEKPQVSEMEIIARASDWLGGEAKREDLEDVVFPGSIVMNFNGHGYLFAGVRDGRVGIKSLKKSPFSHLLSTPV